MTSQHAIHLHIFNLCVRVLSESANQFMALYGISIAANSVVIFMVQHTHNVSKHNVIINSSFNSIIIA